MHLRYVFGALLAALTCVGAQAEALRVLVENAQGQPLEDAVVIAVPTAGIRSPPKPREEIVDQIDREFVPYVEPILVGSTVRFPNKDNIRHHVYSFSPAKSFELPLYKGTPAAPILFDKPGVVVLGCNIHDWMVGYIYVSESPYFAKTGADGKALLNELPKGQYRVRVWHPDLQTPEEGNARLVEVGEQNQAPQVWQLTTQPAIRVHRAPIPGTDRYR
jgi:plastocyanin